jgi:hypothetical protein
VAVEVKVEDAKGITIGGVSVGVGVSLLRELVFTSSTISPRI